MSRKARQTFEEPLCVGSVDGDVAITGPGHVHGAFTPAAARESAQSLLDAAGEAEQQASTSAQPEIGDPSEG